MEPPPCPALGRSASAGAGVMGRGGRRKTAALRPTQGPASGRQVRRVGYDNLKT
jgi:hypothetical protein